MKLPESFKIGNMPYAVVVSAKSTAQLEGATLYADVNIGTLELSVNEKSPDQRQRQGLICSILRGLFVEVGINQKKTDNEDLIDRLSYGLLQFLLDNPIDWIQTPLPPDEFRIGCVTYTRDTTEEGKAYLDGAGLWGESNYDDCKILVDRDIVAPKFQAILLHEVIHAILHEYTLSNTEELVYRLEPALFQLLRDNDFTWIREEGKKL